MLIFDSADDPSINLSAYFPRGNHGNIIITTRNASLRMYAPSNCYDMSSLSINDAMDLLLHVSGHAAYNEPAKTIAIELLQVSASPCE